MTRLSKDEVVNLLEHKKIDFLAEQIVAKKSNLRFLHRLLCAQDQLIRWRAIEAMGVVGKRLAAQDPEKVQVLLRTLLWTMNDESGGIGWGAPECIGEIIHHCPQLFSEFAPIVLSYTEEEMLLPGVIWAAGRIAQADPAMVQEFMPTYKNFLHHQSPVVRGYVLHLLQIMGVKLGPEYGYLQGDDARVLLYEAGELQETTVNQLAKPSLLR